MSKYADLRTSPQYEAPLETLSSNRFRFDFPPSGGASRAFGLPLAAKRVLRAGARTHFRRPDGRRAEKETGHCPAIDFAAGWILICC